VGGGCGPVALTRSMPQLSRSEADLILFGVYPGHLLCQRASYISDMKGLG